MLDLSRESTGLALFDFLLHQILGGSIHRGSFVAFSGIQNLAWFYPSLIWVLSPWNSLEGQHLLELLPEALPLTWNFRQRKDPACQSWTFALGLQLGSLLRFQAPWGSVAFLHSFRPGRSNSSLKFLGPCPQTKNGPYWSQLCFLACCWSRLTASLRRFFEPCRTTITKEFRLELPRLYDSSTLGENFQAR